MENLLFLCVPVPKHIMGYPISEEHGCPRMQIRSLRSCSLFNSPEQSPGRAIVLPPASALASAAALADVKVFMLKFLCDGQGAVRQAILSL